MLLTSGPRPTGVRIYAVPVATAPVAPGYLDGDGTKDGVCLMFINDLEVQSASQPAVVAMPFHNPHQAQCTVVELHSVLALQTAIDRAAHGAASEVRAPAMGGYNSISILPNAAGLRQFLQQTKPQGPDGVILPHRLKELENSALFPGGIANYGVVVAVAHGSMHRAGFAVIVPRTDGMILPTFAGAHVLLPHSDKTHNLDQDPPHGDPYGDPDNSADDGHSGSDQENASEDEDGGVALASRRRVPRQLPRAGAPATADDTWSSGDDEAVVEQLGVVGDMANAIAALHSRRRRRAPAPPRPTETGCQPCVAMDVRCYLVGMRFTDFDDLGSTVTATPFVAREASFPSQGMCAASSVAMHVMLRDSAHTLVWTWLRGLQPGRNVGVVDGKPMEGPAAPAPCVPQPAPLGVGWLQGLTRASLAASTLDRYHSPDIRVFCDCCGDMLDATQRFLYWGEVDLCLSCGKTLRMAFPAVVIRSPDVRAALVRGH